MTNIINKKILVLSLAVSAGLFLLMHKPVSAAALTVTTPTETDSVEFTITDDIIKSWEGTFRLSVQSSAEAAPVSVSNLIRAVVTDEQTTVIPNAPRFNHNPQLIYEWLVNAKNDITSEPMEPHLEIKDGRAVSFTPPQVGQELDERASTLNILTALNAKDTTASLATREVQPKNDLASTNNIGIKELVGRGVSNFARSPKNRRTNIKVGVQKMSGIIIKPGEEFSFNDNLGPVEKEFGFVPELVIKATGTIPELGGGLCQVSSTTFRAAMDAGLPINQRRNHAYAVQYYAPQGTDATIYPGVVDLKFTNDTPASILVWPHFRGEDDLIFDFYGTKDDRKVVLETPIQWDKKSSGAMKASWTRIVTKNGKEDKVTFQSVYQSPALFHKTEEFVPSTPPPGFFLTAPPTNPDSTTPVTPPAGAPTEPPTTPPTQQPT